MEPISIYVLAKQNTWPILDEMSLEKKYREEKTVNQDSVPPETHSMEVDPKICSLTLSRMHKNAGSYPTLYHVERELCAKIDPKICFYMLAGHA